MKLGQLLGGVPLGVWATILFEGALVRAAAHLAFATFTLAKSGSRRASAARAMDIKPFRGVAAQTAEPS